MIQWLAVLLVTRVPVCVFMYFTVKLDFLSQSKQMQSAGLESLVPHSRTLIVCDGLVTCPESFSVFLSIHTWIGSSALLCWILNILYTFKFHKDSYVQKGQIEKPDSTESQSAKGKVGP